MTFKCTQRSGRREMVYRVDADSLDQAREYCVRYLSFLGVEVDRNEIEIMEFHDELA